MTFALGMAAGVLIGFIVWVAYFGPKHWAWYEEREALKKSLEKAIERGDHYKQVATPNQWGPVEQHEARLVPKAPPYQGVTLEPGEAIDFVFDDIKDGGER